MSGTLLNLSSIEWVLNIRAVAFVNFKEQKRGEKSRTYLHFPVVCRHDTSQKKKKAKWCSDNTTLWAPTSTTYTRYYCTVGLFDKAHPNTSAYRCSNESGVGVSFVSSVIKVAVTTTNAGNSLWYS